MNTIILHSDSQVYKNLLHYIYNEYGETIDEIEYLSESAIKPLDYFSRRNKKETKIRVCVPSDFVKDIVFSDEKISIELKTLNNSNNNIIKLIQPVGCNAIEEIIYKELSLSSSKKETIFSLIDKADSFCKDQLALSKKSTKKTVNINVWRKEYWNLLFKSPKRPLETLYLKEGIKEDIVDKVDEFFSEETRGEYLSHGIPYKKVFLLYGVPGSGKTSTINTIASHFNSDIYVIPISKELTDYGLIDAMGYIDDPDSDSNHRIIVIEDIDSIFTDRKKGDDQNGVSLQGLLNCFDGFSCVEGTLLFITANKPEVIDSALLRSCRVDHRYELDYADEYQTKCIFTNIINDDEVLFKSFYKKIKNRQYTTAMLQEFLFYNRKCENIMDKIDDFLKIIHNNKENSFVKNETEKLYS